MTPRDMNHQAHQGHKGWLSHPARLISRDSGSRRAFGALVFFVCLVVKKGA